MCTSMNAIICLRVSGKSKILERGVNGCHQVPICSRSAGHCSSNTKGNNICMCVCVLIYSKLKKKIRTNICEAHDEQRNSELIDNANDSDSIGISNDSGNDSSKDERQ